MSAKSTLWGASLLIAGTSIGAAMLALPVELSSVGFVVAVGISVMVWFIMMLSALFMLEVNLRFEVGTNMISMAHETLGNVGRVVAWGSYLLLLYCLIAAYISGISGLVSEATENWFQTPLYAGVGMVIAVLLFAIMVFLGARAVDRMNRVFIACLVFSFCLFLIYLIPHVHGKFLLQVGHPVYWLQTLPIVVTAFGYQIIIPSLRTYLHSNQRLLRKSIMLGGSIPLLVYVIWMMLVMGSIPETGEHGLIQIWQEHQLPAGLIHGLQDLSGEPLIYYISEGFSFFAIATSLLGVSLSLFDFLVDGLALNKKHFGRLSTVIMTFAPPLIFAVFYPQGFLLALRYGGVFVALLLGILPAAMALAARAKWPETIGYKVCGGNGLPVVVIAFSTVIVISAFIPENYHVNYHF